MIKSIVLKRMDSLDENNKIVINFCPGVNVIVGPKGGGKSTLFSLLASLSKGYVCQDVIKTLKAYQLEFEYIEEFSGEKKYLNNVNKKTKTETIKDFSDRNDVIFQDDPIKKDINSFKEIEDQKERYVEENVNESNDQIAQLINNIENFYNNMKLLVSRNESDDNWSKTFLVKKNNTKANIVSIANYSKNEIKNKIDNQIQSLKEIIKILAEDKNKLNSSLKDLQNKNLIKDELIDKKIFDNIQKIIEHIETTIEQAKNKQLIVQRVNDVIQSFAKSYSRTIDKIKESDFKNLGIKDFELKSYQYFKYVAKRIFDLKEIFKTLLINDIDIKFSKTSHSDKMLSYKMSDNIKLTDEFIVKLLKIFLASPKSINDLSSWIQASVKKTNEFPPFDRKKILKEIVKKLKENVEVLANGKNYETLSLGQKSIYGMTYKYNHSINDSLFLDQPEDNLDNNTIAHNILEMINKKQNQVFIVTHNANIGILTNPGKIIIADLNNKLSPYTESLIDTKNISENNPTDYLEGGFKFLEERYFKIKGD